MRGIFKIFLFLLFANQCSSQVWNRCFYSNGRFHPIDYDSILTRSYLGYNGYTEANLLQTFGDTAQYSFTDGSYTGKRGIIIGMPGYDTYFDGKKWAFMTIDSNKFTPFMYDHIIPYAPSNTKLYEEFYPKLFLASVNGKWGILNSRGKTLVPYLYDLPHMEIENIFSGNGDGKCNLDVDRNCGDLLLINRRFCLQMIGNSIVFKLNGKYGSVDTTGKVVIPFNYDRIENLDVEFITLRKDGIDKTDYMTQKGGVLIGYDDVDRPNNGFMLVWKKKYCGFVDEYGKEIIPCIYTSEENEVEARTDGSFVFSAYKNKKGFIITLTPDGKVTTVEQKKTK